MTRLRTMMIPVNTYTTSRRGAGTAAAVVVALLFLATGLAAQSVYETNPKLPPIPRADGPLDLRVIYPEPGMVRPGVSRNFIFGTTGDGGATLTINGDTVPVAPNGAFLAFLPVPRSSWELIAESGGVLDTVVYEYSRPEGGPPGGSRVHDLHRRAVSGTVTSGVDTLASGSGIAYGAPTKWADRKWMFPIGASFPVLERDGDHLRIDLAGEEAWVESRYVTVSSATPDPHELDVELELHQSDRWVELVIPVEHAPFMVDPQEQSITMTFYNVISYDLEQRLAELGATGSGSGSGTETGAGAGTETEEEPPGSIATWSVTNLPDAVVDSYSWSTTDGRSTATLRVDLRRPLWGFKVYYDDLDRVVLRIRRPNSIDRESPLRGMVIMVDAGHPPRGASGPTGLTEADANLAIALAVEQKLKRKGARVVMTRRDSLPLLSNDDVSAELTARVDLAVEREADILLSIHNNGFSDGVDPWERNGTETYYYHDFAAELARMLQEEVVEVTGVPSLGHKQRSLALIRPTWMPAVLTESLYMMHPQQEQALRDPAFIDALAEAHVRALERFALSRR